MNGWIFKPNGNESYPFSVQIAQAIGTKVPTNVTVYFGWSVEVPNVKLVLYSIFSPLTHSKTSNISDVPNAIFTDVKTQRKARLDLGTLGLYVSTIHYLKPIILV